MNTGRTLLAQLMDFMPLHEFRKCVQRYRGHHRVQSLSCLDQYLCLAFAQLTYRESPRDIEAYLRALQSKLYHMGIRGRCSRNTLAQANERRDWRIYADFAQVVIHVARSLYANDEFGAVSQRRLVSLTNNFELPALTIAKLYKRRWQVGLYLQVGQRAPQDQRLLRHFRERGEDSGWDCYIRICARRNRQEKAPPGPEPPHYSTDSERNRFREITYSTSTYRLRSHNVRGPVL